MAIYNISIEEGDCDKEIKCKKVYNNNYFGVFSQNFTKFKRYSMYIGCYDSKKYNNELFDYNYIKENYPEFIDDEKHFEIKSLHYDILHPIYKFYLNNFHNIIWNKHRYFHIIDYFIITITIPGFIFKCINSFSFILFNNWIISFIDINIFTNI